MKNKVFQISSITIQPGERITLALPTPEIYTCAPMYIPIHIIHGKKAGPILLVCGAIHGDEINGVSITQRLLKLRLLKGIRGTLIVIPSLNIYGMINQSRNLPDRRDLDGSFPGSKSGSYASRLANLLTEEVFEKITHCIDLHTGEPHITRLSQVKTDTKNEQAAQLAKAFQAPVTNQVSREQGLLWLLHKRDIPTIIYETGEALRLDESGIKIGVQGIVRVMRKLDMLSAPLRLSKNRDPIELSSQRWLRAPSSGLCEVFTKLGAIVKKGTLLARISDPFGTEQRDELFSPFDGIVIARNHLPIVNEGEPIFELALFGARQEVQAEEWSIGQQIGDPLE